jgi:multiple sugar transport system substrate-binding protein
MKAEADVSGSIARRLGFLFLAAIVFWPSPGSTQVPAGRISFMVFGDAAERAAYERLVADFTRRHPQVQVGLVHLPGQGDYRKRLGIDFAGGTPADIVLLNYSRSGPISPAAA